MSIHIGHGFLVLVVSISLTSAKPAQAETLDESLLSVENRWANAAYQTAGRQQGKALKNLLTDVRSLHEGHPNSPEAAAWHGIVARTYMDVRGSMSLAREARDALLVAESMDPLVLGGLVYANLGALYSNVPSSLGRFGNKTKGIGYLWKAIVVDPEGIDSNYLYARVLLAEKDYGAARDALIRAKDAPARPDHPEADFARKLEVENLLASVERRL
jgi:tetratricopeptide (TPR) repeat protein